MKLHIWFADVPVRKCLVPEDCLTLSLVVENRFGDRIFSYGTHALVQIPVSRFERSDNMSMPVPAVEFNDAYSLSELTLILL